MCLCLQFGIAQRMSSSGDTFLEIVDVELEEIADTPGFVFFVPWVFAYVAGVFFLAAFEMRDMWFIVVILTPGASGEKSQYCAAHEFFRCDGHSGLLRRGRSNHPLFVLCTLDCGSCPGGSTYS